MQSLSRIIAAMMVAGGLCMAGFFPGSFYYQSKFNNNSVVVKGLSEQDVKADLAVWRLRFTVTDNDLNLAQQQITEQAEKVEAFLQKQGFKPEEITTARIETNDLMANPYRGSEAASSRFILSQTITVKTNRVELVEQALPQSNALIAEGIIFENNYTDPVSYIFTGLNDIKPQMLADATYNAKSAAEEFAKNSGSKVGKIRHANQGVFSILPAEEINGSVESQQINKKVRVVSTIEYWLE